MGLVFFALRKPITILVCVLFIALSTVIALGKMPIDIFPNLRLPVIYVAQPYGGLDPSQMEGFITSYYEYHFLYITGIKEVESKSIQGVCLIKLTFHPDTDMRQALAETVVYVNRSQAFMPPGTVHPFIMRFDTGSVPVGQLVFSSAAHSLGEIQDLALFKVRPMFASLPGVSAPPPFGGNQRTIVVSVLPERLRSYNISPDEVVKAVANGNVITPSGNVRTGDLTRLTPINAVVDDIKELENIPIKLGQGPAIYLRDIGKVEDKTDVVTGYALVNGHRSVYIPVTKRADASTWNVVNEVKKALPLFREVLPPDIKVSFEFDQSNYVRNAIGGLGVETALGALLTGLVVFLFLRNFQSALIVVVTIPIAIFSSIFALYLAGQTINIMTLGGLALAVGILVDEATVTVENIHNHLTHGKSIAKAVVDSAGEIVTPKLLAMLCILAVFIPSFFMAGVPKALFIPLSLSVAFAMAASFLLSQTLVPVLAIYLEKNIKTSETTFTITREKYSKTLSNLLSNRKIILVIYLIIVLVTILFVGKLVGGELFPNVDTKQFKLRIRAPIGTRIERTELITLNVLNVIKKVVGENNIETSLAFVGTQPPSYPINTIFLWTSGPHEAVISIALKERKLPIEKLKEILRKKLKEKLPEVLISFEPADLISQITSLGAPTPIEIAIIGKSLKDLRLLSEKIKNEITKIPNLRDLQFGQPLDYPTIDINIDRKRAGQLGVTVNQVGHSLIAATSSSRFTQPNYWIDKTKGTAYQIQVEIPQSQISSIEDVGNVPVIPLGGSGPLIRDVAMLSYGTAVGEYDRINNIRMVTLTANISGKDLGSISKEISRVLKRIGDIPAGMKIKVRGQVQMMLETLQELQVGLLVAILVVFLLLAANFQSFRLSFVVMSTIPAVLSGVILLLLITRTTLNIQSFMGAIMAVGVAVANAILLVTFAEEYRKKGSSSIEAALQGAKARLRPILMTSLAMIVGMIPMALGIGEGSEQTAPLGRAVIGGLFAGTFATLTILPIVFAIMQEKSSIKPVSFDPTDPESIFYEK